MSKRCIKCGTILDNGAAFCDECGAQQPIAQPQPSTVTPQIHQAPNKKSSKKTILLIIIIVLLTGCLFTGFICVIFSSLMSEVDTSSSTTAPTTTQSVSTDTSTELTSNSLEQYIGISEDELITTFDYEKNESGMYPELNYEDENAIVMPMFYCENGIVTEVYISEKNGYNILGIEYGDSQKNVEKILKDFTLLYNTTDNGSSRYSYANSITGEGITIDYNEDFSVTAISYTIKDSIKDGNSSTIPNSTSEEAINDNADLQKYIGTWESGSDGLSPTIIIESISNDIVLARWYEDYEDTEGVLLTGTVDSEKCITFQVEYEDGTPGGIYMYFGDLASTDSSVTVDIEEGSEIYSMDFYNYELTGDDYEAN